MSEHSTKLLESYKDKLILNMNIEEWPVPPVINHFM